MLSAAGSGKTHETLRRQYVEICARVTGCGELDTVATFKLVLNILALVFVLMRLRDNKETSPLLVRPCLRRNVEPIQQTFHTRARVNIENSLKTTKTTRWHEGKEGTQSFHRHTKPTTKNSKETGQPARLKKGSPHTFLLKISYQILLAVTVRPR